jgi:hypothetical protein
MMKARNFPVRTFATAATKQKQHWTTLRLPHKQTNKQTNGGNQPEHPLFETK